MEWSAQQDNALLSVKRWHEGGGDTPQLFRLFGYAGTGKTTLAMEIANGVGGGVDFLAPTGKSALVLREKGCPNTSTIHQAIYHPRGQSKNRLNELEKELVTMRADMIKSAGAIKEDHPQYIQLLKAIHDERTQAAKPMFDLNVLAEVRHSSLIVVDECSMVDAVIAEDLLSFGVKVLVLGDPGQLPPVKGTGFFIDAPADFMLTDIHRQAKDNPIIRLATEVREEKILDVGQYGDSKVIKKADLQQIEVLEADQIIVGKNQTRADYNRRLRFLDGKDGVMPVIGDKLVCLKNNHKNGLLNGAIWYVKELGIQEDDIVGLCIAPAGSTSEEEHLVVDAHVHHFQGRGSELAWYDKGKADEFDYGYALTCHKSQGSQWDNVMIFDESASFRADRYKWLYTAITRAAEKVTVVKMIS